MRNIDNDERQLIVLAAKASGVTLGEWSHYWQGFDRTDRLVSPKWNPLNSNSQAFYLVSRLRLGIHYEHQESMGEIVEVYYLRDAEAGSCKCATYSLGDDPDDATRRAIVHAAASIGEAQ